MFGSYTDCHAFFSQLQTEPRNYVLLGLLQLIKLMVRALMSRFPTVNYSARGIVHSLQAPLALATEGVDHEVFSIEKSGTHPTRTLIEQALWLALITLLTRFAQPPTTLFS